MHNRTAVIGTLLGIGMVLLSAVPASAQNGSPNLLAGAGVTFIPSQDDAAEPATVDVAPAIKFETPMAMAHMFVPRGADEPHKIAVGIRSGGYAYGFGGLLRMWFSERLFLDIGVSFPYAYGLLNHTAVTGSVLYSFRTWDESDVVIIRLYAGGGINFSRWSWDNDIFESDTDFGGQGLVGTELIFRRLPKLGLGLEVGFYSTNNVFNVGGFGGLGSSIYAIWYFK